MLYILNLISLFEISSYAVLVTVTDGRGDRDFHARGARLLRRELLDFHLDKIGLTGIKAAALMQGLVVSCLNEHDEMVVTRAAGLRNHNSNSQF